MDFVNGLTAELPDPGDDEPDGLRGDIQDELADHLACAYRRELLRGVDPTTARDRVLDRFGDPADVAHRLWFDAMRGRIMSRRILVGYSILLTLVTGGLLLLNGIQASRVQREYARALAAEREARMRHEEAQAQMLHQLEAISRAAQQPRSSDWIPVVFRFIEGKMPGPPVENVRVKLGRGAGGADRPEALLRWSDATGKVDFGVVQPGDWQYTIALPFNQQAGNWSTNGMFSVVPGMSIDRPIICPRLPPEPSTVKPRVQWPDDLADMGLLLELQLQNQGLSFQPEVRWSSGFCFRNLLLGPEADRARHFGGAGSEFWQVARSNDAIAPQAPVYAHIDGLTNDPEGKSWQPGRYQILRLAVLKSPASHQERGQLRRLEVLAFWSSFDNGSAIHLLDQPPSGPVALPPSMVAGGRTVRKLPRIVLSGESAKRMLHPFPADPGTVNEWTIRLPEEMLQVVREKLKAGSRTR